MKPDIKNFDDLLTNFIVLDTELNYNDAYMLLFNECDIVSIPEKLQLKHGQNDVFINDYYIVNDDNLSVFGKKLDGLTKLLTFASPFKHIVINNDGPDRTINIRRYLIKLEVLDFLRQQTLYDSGFYYHRGVIGHFD